MSACDLDQIAGLVFSPLDFEGIRTRVGYWTPLSSFCAETIGDRLHYGEFGCEMCDEKLPKRASSHKRCDFNRGGKENLLRRAL